MKAYETVARSMEAAIRLGQPSLGQTSEASVEGWRESNRGETSSESGS